MSCLDELKQKGLKLTPQRRLIVDLIHDAQSHLTAEDIIARVKSRMPGVNKSTIYRTLELLEQTGCIVKSESSERAIYHHTDEGHHHHLVCDKCGQTIECTDDLFAPVEKSVSKKYGFRINFRHVVISGLCEQCGIAFDR